MDAMAEQMRATLAVQQDQCSSAVVTIGHTYPSSAGSVSKSYTGVRGGLTANQKISLAGNATTETFSVTCSTIPDGETDPAATVPKEGDRVTVRTGGESGTSKTHAVITRQADPTGATQTIILGPQYA